IARRGSQSVLDRVAVTKPFDRLADCTHRLATIDPELGESGNPGADTEDCSLAGNLVERRDRHRRQCRVAREGVSHTGPKENFRSASSEVRQTGVDLTVEPLISQPHRTVTDRLRGPRALDHRLYRGIAEHQ